MFFNSVHAGVIKVLPLAIIIMLLLTIIFIVITTHYSNSITLLHTVLLLEEVWWQVSLRTASQAPPWHVFETGNRKTSAVESKHPPSFFHGRSRQSHLPETGGTNGRK